MEVVKEAILEGTSGAIGEPISSGRRTEPHRSLKVVAGIDPHQPFDAVMHTLRSLSPNGMDVHLVHGFNPEPKHNARERGRTAELTLTGARAALEASGLGAAWIQRTADPAEALIDVAEAEGADLIAIGSPIAKGGRVARALLKRSPVSILVARRAPPQEGIRVVLATDHSPFMNSCIRRLLAMNPGGIREIVVLTANEVSAGAVAMLVHGLPDLSEKAEHWISEKLMEENQRVCELLAPLGAECRAEVREGTTSTAISKSMSETESDLLLIGAPEHCLLEKLAYGSASEDQFLNAPYSVLALRP